VGIRVFDCNDVGISLCKDDGIGSEEETTDGGNDKAMEEIVDGVELSTPSDGNTDVAVDGGCDDVLA